jgi:hypothetical protein
MTKNENDTLKNGKAAAALVAGGIGAFMVGFMTVLAEASQAAKTFLTFSEPVGPLSGKVIVAVIIWLITWFVLGMLWKDKELDFNKATVVAFVFLALGLLFTFPPFFLMFEA